MTSVTVVRTKGDRIMKLLKRTGTLLLVMLSWYVTSEFSLSASTSEEDKRPNILFIVVDDQSPFDLQAYNPSSILDTPVISQLAADGMVLDAAYHMGADWEAMHAVAPHDHVWPHTLAHPEQTGTYEQPPHHKPSTRTAGPRSTHAASRLQSRRVRHHADLQKRKQLRGSK